MKIFLLLLSSFYLSGLQAQVNQSFEQKAEFIQKKVSCCSVPFAASTKGKVENIAIAKNGDVTLSYSDKRPNQSFNILKLYKEEKGATGIDTILGGKFIQFYVSEHRVRLIRFATAQDAMEVYEAFLQLMELPKKETKLFENLNIMQTVDFINIRLAKWAEAGNAVKLSALEDGSIGIQNKRNQFLRFNMFELIPPHDGKWEGVEISACDPRVHVPLGWISFNSLQNTKAFIRFDCNTPEMELEIIKSAFLHLRSLYINSNSSYSRPNGAMYFVNRGVMINANNDMLVSSIRSQDKKDEGDTTLFIKSNGEGWLDKDSLPVGEWRFYAADSAGNEYLFKTGNYQPTNNGMFTVRGIDSSYLAKKYHLSFLELNQRQVQSIPFIKWGKWNYYHSDGSLWKSVSFINKEIPITVQIMIVDADNPEVTMLVTPVNDKMDEWLEEDEN